MKTGMMEVAGKNYPLSFSARVNCGGAVSPIIGSGEVDFAVL